MRAGIIENGRVSRFLYYNGELLTESDQDETVTSRYLLGYGVAAGWQNGKEGYHSYHLDEQNSTAYITDSGQWIENSYQYDTFRGIRSNNEKINNRILYTGKQFDQVTGQSYLRARYYNPLVGRFLQEDVYRGDGLNLYAYCSNNPVVYYDPSGEAGNRQEYLGGTPKIISAVGKEVLQKGYEQGTVSISKLPQSTQDKITDKGFQCIRITSDMKSQIEFQSPTDRAYYPLTEVNMSHKNYNSHGLKSNGEPYTDAVVAWNTELKQYGVRSDEARAFMKDSDQYYLERNSYNKSDGASLGMTYDPPNTPLRAVEEAYPQMKADKSKEIGEDTINDEKC